MQINIPNPVYQTSIFALILIGIVALTTRKDPSPHEMNHSHTNELKGIAVLMIIFSHIGYFLFTDHRFLFPLSVSAGVGVNIFLVLSGFGLASSENRSRKTLIDFYKKRLKSIFIPMWLVLSLILILDFFLLNKTYELPVVIKSFLGFFPYADIYQAINSPLWYFSFILFYYLVFPLIYHKNRQLLSIGIILVLGYMMTNLNLPVYKDVLKLYKLHYLAFPLGMFFAYLKDISLDQKIRKSLLKLSLSPWIKAFIKYPLVLFLSLAFGYTAIHSGIGEKLIIEQITSLTSVVILISIFIFKDFQSNFLIVLGKYSYEIYLIQWPLMYRYDFIYKHTSGYIGTLLYLAVFIFIGFILNRFTKTILKKD